MARIGDGWFPQGRPDSARGALLEKVFDYAREEGRSPESIGIEAWVSVGNRSPDAWAEDVAAWRDIGATHVSVNTMGAGLGSPDAHIEAIRRFKDAMEGA